MIKLELKDAIAWVRIDRPKQKNALSIALLESLVSHLKALESNSTIRVIIIRGNRDFSSGGDIQDMFVTNEKEALALAEKVQNLYHQISEIQKPIIAYTQGLVFGGGFELALACDIIISHPDALFSLPEAALGIVPGGGGTQRLKQAIGQHNSAYVLFTGEKFSAQRMLALNLIQEITDQIERVCQVAETIAKQSPRSIQVLKNLLKKDLDFKAESQQFSKLIQEDGKQGIQSFIDKKKLPNW